MPEPESSIAFREEEANGMTRSDGWDTVGIFIFPGFEPLDAYGPMELFGSMIREGLRKVKRIVLVAETAGPVPSCFGPCSIAEYGVDDCPPLDVLVLSGGIGTRILMHNNRVLEWIRKQTSRPDLRHVFSVCTGASQALFVCSRALHRRNDRRLRERNLIVHAGSMLLGASGVLDGREATTNKELFSYIRSLFPAVNWHGRARWVRDGKYITASGVTAGMDAALYLLEREFGSAIAEKVAVEIEYSGNWREPDEDPFAHSTDQDSD